MNDIILKILDNKQCNFNVVQQNFEVNNFTKVIKNRSFTNTLDSFFLSVNKIETDLKIYNENFYIFPIFYYHAEYDEQYTNWQAYTEQFVTDNLDKLSLENTCLCICDLYETSNKLKEFAETIQEKYSNIKVWVITANKKLQSNHIKIIYNDTWIQAFDPLRSIVGYKPKKLYINLTRVARIHRCLLVDQLMEKNLLKLGYNSWGDVYDVFSKYKEQFPNTQIEKAKFDVLDIDDLNKVNPFDSIPINHCIKSFVYLSTETSVSSDSLFFSEKIYKPIAIGMPFLTLGNPGTLQDLRARGFLTFGDWFDESYDLDYPIQKRIDILTNNLKKYSKYDIKDLISIRNEMSEVVNHNFNLYTVIKRKNYLKENLRLAAEGIL